MQRFFLEIAYDGSDYHGWQLQPGVNTVQQEIENALTRLNSNERVPTLGCGRTDTGVHARQFFLHFELDQLPCEEEMYIFKLNRMLPHSISVYGIHHVSEKANARFDATSRTYEYHINQNKDAFLHNRSWNLWADFDIEKMNMAAALLLEYYDFASFQKSGANSGTTICTITRAGWEQFNNRAVFTITANRFLRNMVRAIVGTLLEVGKGNMTIDEFRKVIESRDRTCAGDSAAACGLYLTKVTYPYIRETDR